MRQPVISQNSRVTLGLLIVIVGGLASFFIMMNALASKREVDSIVESKVGAMRNDILYLRNKVDGIDEYLRDHK